MVCLKVAVPPIREGGRYGISTFGPECTLSIRTTNPGARYVTHLVCIEFAMKGRRNLQVLSIPQHIRIFVPELRRLTDELTACRNLAKIHIYFYFNFLTQEKKATNFFSCSKRRLNACILRILS